MSIALCATALVVGALIGAVGIGGILLIPAINAMTSLTIQESMATALSTFVFTGLTGTILFQRRGSIDWSLTLPLCAGAAIFGFVGAWSSAYLDARALTQLLAAITLFAGLYTMLSRIPEGSSSATRRVLHGRAFLFGIGAVTGFGSGLTGVGGPALSVPIMILLGFPTLPVIGASQVIQIVAALSGTIGHLAQGTVHLGLAAALTVIEVIGVWFGVRAAHAVDVRHLRTTVGALSILVGIGLAVRSLTAGPPATDRPPIAADHSPARPAPAAAPAT